MRIAWGLALDVALICLFLGTVLLGWRAVAMLLAGWRLRRPAVHESA